VAVGSVLDKKRNAARANAERRFFQPPLRLPARRLFPSQPASGCREKVRTRVGKFQDHADALRPRNTPLLSSARRTCKELVTIPSKVAKLCRQRVLVPGVARLTRSPSRFSRRFLFAEHADHKTRLVPRLFMVTVWPVTLCADLTSSFIKRRTGRQRAPERRLLIPIG